MSQPEKLNIWDRLFNRYRREILKRGEETWSSRDSWTGIEIPNSTWTRHYVEYKIIDRVTGSERIEKEYLD